MADNESFLKWLFVESECIHAPRFYQENWTRSQLGKSPLTRQGYFQYAELMALADAKEAYNIAMKHTKDHWKQRYQKFVARTKRAPQPRRDPHSRTKAT